MSIEQSNSFAAGVSPIDSEGTYEVSGGHSVPVESSVAPERNNGSRARRPARSGGPRTAAGKRRSATNRLRTGLCPPWVARDLKPRGEDPARFSRLHRELLAWLAPDDARTSVMVQTLAETWWEKLRRARNWVGAGAADTSEVDARLDEHLRRLGFGMLVRHRKWRGQLERTFGAPVPGPATLRRLVEERLPALGGKAPKRYRPSWRAGKQSKILSFALREFEMAYRAEKSDEEAAHVFDLMRMWKSASRKAAARASRAAEGS